MCKIDQKSPKMQNKNLGIYPDGYPECDPDVTCECEIARGMECEYIPGCEDGEICEDPYYM